MSTAATMPCPADHKHGATSTCYSQHGCRCFPCRVGRADASRSRYRAKAHGRFVDPFVDAAPVREHVKRLQEYGVGWTRTVELAGVSKGAVQRLLIGRSAPVGDPRKGEEQKRILRTTADAVLAVRLDLASLAPGTRIPSTGMRRRAEALIAIGWSRRKIAAELGALPENFAKTLHADLVTVRRHLALAQVYDRLAVTRPPLLTPFDRSAASRSLNQARREGWPPPLAWDDIDLDAGPVRTEESGAVDEIAVELATAGADVHLTSAERVEAVRVLNGRGVADREIAALLRLAPRSVLRIRTDYDIAPAQNAARERIVA